MMGDLTATNWPTSTKPPGGSGEFPLWLDCGSIPQIGKGPTWNKLTIGISSKADVDARFYPAIGYVRPGTDDSILYWIQNEQSPDLLIIEACFRKSVLLALNIAGAKDLPRTLTEFIETYGPPDDVTWAYSYFDRSLIWGTQGILAVVSVTREETFKVILFPSLSNEQLHTSWVRSSLPPTMPPHYGDLPPLPHDKEVKNPWGIVLNAP